MKDFIECFIEDFLEKFFAIIKIIIAILVYCTLVFFITGVISALLNVPFWPTYLVIALLPAVALVLAFLWEIGSRLWCWLWWKKRR